MKKIFLFIAAAIMSVGIASAQELNEAITLAKDGNAAFEIGEYTLAIEAFTKALTITESIEGDEAANHAGTCKTAICAIYLANSKALLKAGDYDGALTKLNETISIAEQYGSEGTVNDAIVSNTATIGEKLTLRRVTLLEKTSNDSFGSYLHMGGKIGAVCVLSNTDKADVAKDVAMHIAASSPLYINTTDIPSEETEKELHIQSEAAKNDEKLQGKPEAALVKILEGKINKWKAEISLVEQPFVKDPGLSVGKYVAQSGATVTSFIRYAVGEGLQKREDNFAEEVMSQVGK